VGGKKSGKRLETAKEKADSVANGFSGMSTSDIRHIAGGELRETTENYRREKTSQQKKQEILGDHRHGGERDADRVGKGGNRGKAIGEKEHVEKRRPDQPGASASSRQEETYGFWNSPKRRYRYKEKGR